MGERPKTEDFLTFLCLRGTNLLPPELDFFNKASVVPQNNESSDDISSDDDKASLLCDAPKVSAVWEFSSPYSHIE